jgi:N-acetylmuramoyl-L-alanine amidase
MADSDLSLGDHGDVVAQITNTLARIGLLPAASSSFDAAVESAVKAFQQERGLTVTGIVSGTTLRALEDARWKLGDRVLSLQSPTLMRGDDVTALQNRLSQMGFDCGKVDGFYGIKTESALKEFQQSVGTKVDGTCGPATVMALMRLVKTVSSGAPSGLREDAIRVSRGPALANKIIVLDPSSEDQDAELAFDIAQRLEGRLIALGVAVFLTRSSTMKPSDSARVTLANSLNTDLVISLHTDNYKNESAHGIATYYYGSDHHGVHSIVGERFAALVQREITARTDLLNCRTHAKSWDLLRLTKAPTVRIDLGYLSNPGDAKRLADPVFRETIVESLMIAIQRLYLSSESDAKTGTLKISDLRRAGLRSQ